MKSNINAKKDLGNFVIPEEYKSSLKELVDSVTARFLTELPTSGNTVRRYLQGLEILTVRLPGIFPNEAFNATWNSYINDIIIKSTKQRGHKPTEVVDVEFQKFIQHLIRLDLLEVTTEKLIQGVLSQVVDIIDKK
ncbi:hypothetical protein K2X92_05440 [Candidatus Gracilibacteria bacterium]|nr:hypothetical protein [Candidatus Gracilibacteria bacterium]